MDYLTENAYQKDILRTIKSNWKRFLAIAVIVILGVGMFSGLRAACMDLRVSADRFYDAQNLHDIEIQSTLGLTEEDRTALENLPEVETAEGSFGTQVKTRVKDKSYSLMMTSLCLDGTDEPYVLKGKLPVHKGEAAITEKLADDAGLSVGDTFRISENDTAEDEETEQNIVSDADDTEDVETALDLPDFKTDTYKVTAVITDVQDVNSPSGAVSYRSSSTADYPVYVSPSSVNSNIYSAVKLRLKGAEKLFTYSKAYTGLVQKTEDVIQDTVRDEREEARYQEVKQQAGIEIDQSEKDVRAQLERSKKKLEDAEEESNQQINEAEERLDEEEQKLNDAEEELNSSGIGSSSDARVRIADGRSELLKAREELEREKADAKQKIQDAWDDYYEGKAEAEQKIRDARDDLDEIEFPTWYIEDRSNLSGYENIASDADSIEAIATVFPIVFFAVAILISLTAITRMVDEERGLIGTYKALGLTNREIRKKYLVYTAAAGIAGCIIGTFAAFVIMPEIIFVVFRTMYLLPEYVLTFVPVSGIFGPAVFLGGILLAAAISCQKRLREMPAELMRPEAPKKGVRIFLERIRPIWDHMRFLNKITARNLFRYKKRMFMTIFGIAGCVALLLFGFAVNDSVHDLMPRQYENVFRYDMMAVSAQDGDKLLNEAKEAGDISDYQELEILTVKLKKDGQEINAQLMILPDDADLDSYIHLETPDGRTEKLASGKIFLTRNAVTVLGSTGSLTVSLPDMQEGTLKSVTSVENYLGNYIYMTESDFKQIFPEEDYEANGILAHFSSDVKDPVKAGDAFAKKDGVTTCITTQSLRDQFQISFRLMTLVVYVVIVMSAALAFVVLFTLSTTNISERVREIATIKVLGLYHHEVHMYLNKETFLLTAIGIILGMPLGYLFAQTLSVILKLPSIYLKVSLHPVSYGIAAVLAFLFAMIVSLMTNRMLDRIDPAEALKSVE